MAPPPTVTHTPSAPPTNILFLHRLLHPATLLLATVFPFSLQTLPYFLIFLYLHRNPSYTISFSTFQALPHLLIFLYSLVALLVHATFAILIATSLLSPSSLSPASFASLSIPRYDISPWQGIRYLLPHLFVFVSALLVLFVPVPSPHPYATSRFILVWFRRRARRRKSKKLRLQSAPRPPDPPRPYPSNLSESEDDDDIRNQPHSPPLRQKLSPSGPPPITPFTAYFVGHPGFFWNAISTAAIAVAYSSLATFIFLAIYSILASVWAFGLNILHPQLHAPRLLRLLRLYRIYVLIYLVALVAFQLPWLSKYSAHEGDQTTVQSVLQLLGLVTIDTALPAGWTAVMAFASAVATYLFTGMMAGALHAVDRVNEYHRIHPGNSSQPSLSSSLDEESAPALSRSQGRAKKLSYYEVQVLNIVMHASSLGLLVWALVFPGIFTLPLLVAALVYLGVKSVRKSKWFDYLIVYAFVLQMAHFLLVAIVNAFDLSVRTSPVIRLLGLSSLDLQFSVNVIESVAIGLLCMNVSSKRYMAEFEDLSDRAATPSRSMEIHEFVRSTVFSSRTRKRESLYSPLKLCIDQLALASLYVAGGLDVTALNSVFLVALAAICVLQSFGLFRRPRIFATAWAVVLVYSILFLLTTGTFCRATDAIWRCNLDFEGVKRASGGQVVAYAATVVLASVQVNFTWSTRAVEEEEYLKDFETRFWRVLRKYFLYAAYAALLLYPLLSPANFLSYGYVLFLFMNIVVEIVLPSLKGEKADVRRLVRKYWILVIVFSCAAMLSRYFVRLRWFSDRATAQSWFFGLQTDNSRKFAVTLGDAIVLIVMSLQGRLFVVDYLVDKAKSQYESKQTVLNQKCLQKVDSRNTVSEPGQSSRSLMDLQQDDDALPQHRRYRSMEEYLNEGLSARLLSDASFEEAPFGPGRTSRATESRVSHTIATSIPGAQDFSTRPGDDDSDVARRLDEEAMVNELQQILNRARIEQALDMFRNFRKSVAVKQTEKFIHDTYSLAVILLRNCMLQYSYVLETVAILGASIWLPGVSVFGAVYLFLGCMILLAEQPSFKGRRSLVLSGPGQWISKSIPTVLIIFSFTLMSAQYIYLIVYFINDPLEGSVPAYIGLQAPTNESDLPITIEAMIAHVLVFITAIVQEVAVRWARTDAELLIEEERGAAQLQDRIEDPIVSRDALDSAIPIGSVLQGVGGSTSDEPSRPAVEQGELSPSKGFGTDWSELSTWKTTRFQAPALDSSGQSDASEQAISSELSDARRGSEQEVIEKLRWKVKSVLEKMYGHATAVLSLLSPFWKEWGFDVTFAYLVICGVVTRTVFSVIDIGIVLALGGLKRRRVQNHWHQISLLLVILVMTQYLLTLGFHRVFEQPDEAAQVSSNWRQWLLLDRDNDTTERKVAIMFSFIAVICSGITLNSVSRGSRSLRYWFVPLHSEGTFSSLPSQKSEEEDNRGRLDLSSQENGQNSLRYSPLDGRSEQSRPSQEPQPAQNREMDSNDQPMLGPFISGLGGMLGGGLGQLQRSSFQGLEFAEPEQTSLEPWRVSDDQVAYRDFEPGRGDASMGLRPPARSPHLSKRRLQGAAEDKSGEVEKHVFRTTDANDFTRRPISFKNWVKLSWMRFAGPLVHLYMFAVASVDTNIINAVLLLMAFSFLFQFTDVAAKKSRFMLVRVYVIVVILALVIFQAPFGSSSDDGWEEIVGLFKKDTSRGETVLGLMVSLWFFCQILARVYESSDFSYVEKYGEEDAKVRFKRAVHEHNSRKYDKMLDRNKAERSHYARKSRLTRLKALKESEKTVDAFYNVCVLQEVEFIRKQAEIAEATSGAFGTYRLLEEGKKEENFPKGFNSFVRKLLRGKRWKQYAQQPLPSEAKSFITRYSAWPVYATMVLAALLNPSVTTIAYPIAVFLYLIVEQPRPPKQAWTALMVYVCAIIAFKFAFRSPQIDLCEGGVPFFSLGPSPPSVRNFDDCAFAAGLGFDIFVLLALLGHRAVLYSRGVWDLMMSEEDMLLRGEIRGVELATPAEMSCLDSSSSGSSRRDDRDHPQLRRADMQYWTAQQQCEDVEHILNQARGDIAGSEDVSLGVSKISPVRERGNPTFTAAPVLPTRRPAWSHTQRDSNAVWQDREGTKPGDSEGGEPAIGPAEEFWNARGIRRRPASVRLAPKSAPPPRQMRNTNPQATPSSIQDSDISKGYSHLNRFRSFRTGLHRTAQAVQNEIPMTTGQSRIQESLIQGRVIPQQRFSTGRDGKNLALFHVKQKGIFSLLRQYFSRLTKENDHKAVGDYYLLIFIVDFISFVYVMFGFSAIFGEDISGREQTWWTTNFIETRHLVTLFAMFMMIILDRICYLTRSMTGKLVLQYSSVIVYHIVLFLVQDIIGYRVATRLFYVLRCIYFLLSGLQIRDGFPMYTTAQFLLRNYTTPGIILFEIYIFVPFLWLTRTLLDWAVLPTSLEIFQYFRFIDIYLWLYRNRAVNRSRGAFRRELGQKRRLLPRVYQGFGLFLLCVIALFAPFIIFSIFNPFFVARDLRDATVTVHLLTFDSNTSTGATSYPIFSRTSVIGDPLNLTLRRKAARDINVELDVREREKVFEAWFSTISDELWQPAQEDKEALVSSLEAFPISDNATRPRLAFSLKASTTERSVFGTKSQDLFLKKDQANELAKAISNGDDLAMKVKSPLSRYSILQSSSSVFQSYPDDEGTGDVCIRLLQQGAAIWTMGNCANCNCSKNSTLDTNAEIRHLLQVADISSLQVGGATILTLYTAILFTIANLLKKMFFDKRLIIPFIDMPYTLHLYQLVLDIMYARQDNQLEMEEILYNGLVDIYRDQHELVRWTGERALKLPAAWWDRSEVDDPFMVYPSFLETPTEPYIDRTVD